MLIETSVGNFGSFKDMRKCMELDKLETIEVYDVKYWGIHVSYGKGIYTKSEVDRIINGDISDQNKQQRKRNRAFER